MESGKFHCPEVVIHKASYKYKEYENEKQLSIHPIHNDCTFHVIMN